MDRVSEDVRRAKNFTDAERDFLYDLALQSKDIIENKKIDGTTIRQKRECWEEIAVKYNAICQTGPRTEKQLHALYDSIKKKARKTNQEDKKVFCELSSELLIPNKDEDFTPNDIPELISEEDLSSPDVLSDSPTPQLKKKKTNFDLLTSRIVDRKNFKDKLNVEVQHRKEEILDIEKAIKVKQMETANVELAIKKTELAIREKDLQMKIEEIAHKRRIQEIELQVKNKELDMMNRKINYKVELP